PTASASPSSTARATLVPSPTATATATMSIPAAGSSDEWPMIGHDPGQSYADPDSNLSAGAIGKLHLRWVMAGASPAIESSGTLYALTNDQKVLALNAETGAIMHQYLSTKVQSLAH